MTARAVQGAMVDGMRRTFPIPPLRWSVAPAADPAAARALAEALSVPPPLAALLVQRGAGDPATARSFLRPDLERLSDPFSLAGMREAVEVIAGVVAAKGRILVHGDY
ncbi:MAG TPA: hypothetical protein VFI13_09015, partial [Gemmatimonadales bacterium]|nr:hypothetical protein [Gemmatimonadales bacterium]